MKTLLSTVMSIMSLMLFGQDIEQKEQQRQTAVIRSFIHDLADENKAIDIILSQYLIVNHPSDELYDYLEVSLEEIRINLMAKKIEDIVYIPYGKMPRKDIRDIDNEDLDPQCMYFVHYRGRQLTAVYLEDEKIASFTLVSKGGNKAHFVRY